MLHFLQERVNKATKTFDVKPTEQKGTPATDEATQLAKKQGRVHDLMRRLADKMAKETETESGR